MAVDRMMGRAHAAEAGTYTATYRVRQPDGTRATTRLAQQPPKFVFELVQGKRHRLIVSDGKVMHGCVSSGGRWRCAQIGFEDAAGVGTAFPTAVLQSIDSLVQVAGYEFKVGTTTRTVLGVPVDCATFTATMENPPPAQVFCVRNDGVLAYASTAGGQVVELTGFKPSVAASDLVPPA